MTNFEGAQSSARDHPRTEQLAVDGRGSPPSLVRRVPAGHMKSQAQAERVSLLPRLRKICFLFPFFLFFLCYRTRKTLLALAKNAFSKRKIDVSLRFVGKVNSEFCQILLLLACQIVTNSPFLEDSFSAVSKPISASKYSCCGMFQALQDLLVEIFRAVFPGITTWDSNFCTVPNSTKGLESSFTKSAIFSRRSAREL